MNGGADFDSSVMSAAEHVSFRAPGVHFFDPDGDTLQVSGPTVESVSMRPHHASPTASAAHGIPPLDESRIRGRQTPKLKHHVGTGPER